MQCHGFFQGPSELFLLIFCALRGPRERPGGSKTMFWICLTMCFGTLVQSQSIATLRPPPGVPLARLGIISKLTGKSSKVFCIRYLAFVRRRLDPALIGGPYCPFLGRRVEYVSSLSPAGKNLSFGKSQSVLGTPGDPEKYGEQRAKVPRGCAKSNVFDYLWDVVLGMSRNFHQQINTK